jgi:hypothetical protein
MVLTFQSDPEGDQLIAIDWALGIKIYPTQIPKNNFDLQNVFWGVVKKAFSSFSVWARASNQFPVSINFSLLLDNSKNVGKHWRILWSASHMLTHVRNFIPRYETLYPGTKLPTQVRNFLPRYETLYPGTKLHTQVRNFISRYETSYPGTKLYTQVRNFIPGYGTSSLP